MEADLTFQPWKKSLEPKEKSFSLSKNEVLDLDQLAGLEASELLMADKIAAIEGCIASAGH
jgi:hypothetical protein